MKKALLFSILVCLIGTANAQWHFSITSITDNCGSNASLYAIIETDILKSLATDIASKTYGTKEECERMRSQATINYSKGGCIFKTTTSPCFGGNIGNGNGIGGSLQDAASQFSSTAIGEPYFAPNEVYAVSNTGRDLEIKLEALNKSFNDAVGIRTGDLAFDINYRRQANELPNKNDRTSNEVYASTSISRNRIEIDPNKPLYVNLFDAPRLEDYSLANANIENVQRYIDSSNPLTDDFIYNPSALETLLKSEFERISGYNLDSIRNIWPDSRSKEGQQALDDYGAYRVKKIEQMNEDIARAIDNSPEKKEIDAAILALDSYGDDKEGWLGQTNYQKLELESLPKGDVSNEHQSILSVAEKINECNKTQSETGFHAELYYNEATGTYVIAFRGSEFFTDLNDDITDVKIGTNAVLGTNFEIKQYEMAMEIAEVINKIPIEERDKLNIEVVGHSLGGGLASIVGLETGIDAKTFNAAMVPDNFLKEKGLYDKVNNGDVQNITAYHTSSDFLTAAQGVVGKHAIGNSVDIGNTQPEPIRHSLEPSRDVAATNMAIGIKNSVEEHRMKNVVPHIVKNNTEKKKVEWDELHNAQDRLQRELRSAETRP